MHDLSLLPSQFKIFISSRPEPLLQNMFNSVPPQFVHRHDQSDGADGTIEADIRAFICSRMTEITTYFDLGKSWPRESTLDLLAQKAAGSFIWASTAMKVIEDSNISHPETQLKFVLYGGCTPEVTLGTSWLDLNQLYLQVLRQACPKDRIPAYTFKVAGKVIGATVVMRNPLSAAALGSLLGSSISSGQDEGDADTKAVILRTARKLQAVL
jgi:hypothetical protein